VRDVEKWLEEIKFKQRQRHAKNIETVKREHTPQHILAMKELWQDLTLAEDSDRKVFPERVVNRLMHLAYLSGLDGVEDRSARKGYSRAVEKMAQLLESL